MTVAVQPQSEVVAEEEYEADEIYEVEHHFEVVGGRWRFVGVVFGNRARAVIGNCEELLTGVVPSISKGHRGSR